MRTRTLLRLGMTILVMGIVAAGCSRERTPETEPPDRDRPVTDTRDRDQPDEGTMDDTEGAARSRAMASIQNPIFFAFDSSELSTDARETLRGKSEALRTFPEIRVRIEGHADERGTVEYNLALGERRAEAAKDYLVNLGIDPERLTTISYGEERPAVEGSGESAWSQNRRDEFVPLGV